MTWLYRSISMQRSIEIEAGSHARPEIIPGQIDQHHMFGTFLLVGEKFLFQREIFVVGASTASRAQRAGGW